MNKSEAGKLGYKKSNLAEYVNNVSRKASEEYNKNPKNCLMCNKVITYQNRYNDFCSHSCAATVNNKKRKGYKAKECKGCGSLFYKGANVYCDVCVKSGVSQGRATDTASCKSAQAIRRIVLETSDYKCSECGTEEWNGKPIPLQVHHIDGHPDNNVRENLCLVCPNCHAQTDSFGSKNKGNGRKLRYKRANSEN